MKSRTLSLYTNLSLYYAFHFFRYLFPLILSPYLARVLQLQAYGTLILVSSIILFPLALLDFGFQVSAVRAIATSVADRNKGAVISNVLAAKALFTPIALLVFAAVVLFYPSVRNHPGLVLAAATLLLAQGYSLAWYFQGIERGSLAVLFETATQIIYLFGVVGFVHSQNDFVMAVWIQALATLVPTLAAYVLVYRRERLPLPSSSEIRRQIVASNPFFWLRASQLTYTNAMPLIVGYLSLSDEIAYYGIADKFLSAIVGLMGPLIQALLPFLSRHISEDRLFPWRIVYGTLFATMGLTVVLCVLVGFNADFCISLLFGQNYVGAAAALRIYIACGPLIATSIVIGYFVLVPMGKERYLTGIALVGGFAGLVSSFVLVPVWGAAGATAARLITEAIIALSLVLLLSKVTGGQRRADP